MPQKCPDHEIARATLEEFMASHGGCFVLDTHIKTLNRLAEKRKIKCNFQHL